MTIIINETLSRHATPTNDSETLSRDATPTSEIIALPVSRLGISRPHLVRALDETYVAELVETDEAMWDPIEVRAWPDEWVKPSPDVVYHVVSGNHRTSAAKIKNLQTVRGRIIEATSKRDYLCAAARTNNRHGRNFKEEERRDVASQMKQEGMTVEEIAAVFHVYRSTVYNWLNGRDSNASKKKAAREQAQNTLAKLGIPDLSEEWQHVPTVTADAKRLAKVGQTISNFLAETPRSEEKAYIVAWIRSLTKEARLSHSQDMIETIKWLTNVTTLLKSEM